MSVENWDEIRTAFQVAKHGTVSGAAQALGVHHATVIRHIDALENRLGAKLFQRHPRGYTATEAGSDLLTVAQTTDDQFSQLVSRIKGQGEALTGDLVITSISSLSGLVVPVLREFQRLYPQVTVRYLMGERLFRLEYGEAHVAIRSGHAPEEPDNVVQPFYTQKIGLYAHKSYFDTFGQPDPENLLANMRFIGHDNLESRAPFLKWLMARVSPEQVVYRTADFNNMRDAIMNGMGAGFMGTWQAAKEPDLVELMAPIAEWDSPSWLVTHVDLHRTPKVQAFLALLKEAAKDWNDSTVAGQ